MTLTRNARDVRRRGTRCAAPGVELELGGHTRGDARGGRSDRDEPRRAARAAGVRRGARARRRDHRRARAGVALGEGAGHRDHRHEGKVDDDDADRPDAAGGRTPGAGRRKHRRAAERAGRCLDAGHGARRRGEQLSARDDDDVPSVDRAVARTSPTTTSIGIATVEAYAAAKARIFANQRPSDWAVVNADDPVVMARSGAERARGGCWFSPPARSTTASWSTATGSCAARATTVERLIPVSAVELTGRAHAGQRGGGRGGRDIAGVRLARRWSQALRGFPRARARDGAGGRDRRRAVRQRFEGDQRRGGAAIDRELRPRRRGDRRRPVTRAATCASCARRWRRAAGR